MTGHASDKRASRRVPFRVIVRFGTSRPPEHTAFLTDLSETGVCIKTNTVYRAGTAIFMEIELGQTVHECEGTVTWAKKVSTGMARVLKSGMGVHFTRVDKDLLDHYRSKAG